MRILSLIISTSVAISFVHAASFDKSSNEQQAVDILPVSYGLKKRTTFVKRDYATTLRYLRAAMANYRKDAVTPPSAEFVQLEQSLPPSLPPPLSSPPPPPAPEQQEPQHLDFSEPYLPNLAAPPEQPADEATTALELGSKSTEKTIPSNADIEDDDVFDPEEDPDDVDDPPIVNGVAVDREE